MADPATAIKEFGGIIQDNFVPCFPKELIHQMFTGDPMETTSSPEYIFITVDPSGGGMSQLAICSGYYTLSGEFVVNVLIHFKNPQTERGTSESCGGF